MYGVLAHHFLFGVQALKVIGLDPGLGTMGWGIIQARDNCLRHVAHGVIVTNKRLSLAERLVQLADLLERIVEAYDPTDAAVEESFVNQNAKSTLRLGQARGIALLVTARAGLQVTEYLPNLVKKTVVGAGHAAKPQVEMMVRVLLPGAEIERPDEADALAVAICHIHHQQTSAHLSRVVG